MHDGRKAIARSYDQLVERGYFADEIGGNEQFYGALMVKAVPRTARSLLEVGAGSGLWLATVLRARPELREVRVVECSSVAAARCRQRIAPLVDARGGTLTVIEDDFATAQLGTADVVASSYVAEYMGEPQRYIAALRALTAPGGVTIVVDVQTQASARPGARLLLATFARVVAAHLRRGLVPSLRGMLATRRFYGLLDEPAFGELRAFHASYAFPRAAWREVARAVPGGRYVDLGLAGMLVLPREVA